MIPRQHWGKALLGCGCLSIFFVFIFVFGVYVLLHHQETKAAISDTERTLSDRAKASRAATGTALKGSTGYISDGFKDAAKRTIEKTNPAELHGPVGAMKLGAEVWDNAVDAIYKGLGKTSDKGWSELKKSSGADDTKYEKKRAEDQKAQEQSDPTKNPQ